METTINKPSKSFNLILKLSICKVNELLWLVPWFDILTVPVFSRHVLTGTACSHLGEDDCGQNIEEGLENQVH